MQCVSCGKTFGNDLNVKDYEGYTLECPHCDFSMVINNGKLLDFNQYLKDQYAAAGVKIDNNKNYTQSFVEI
jgi:DNA-directed RNA polymerase subunit RPC12/RpoP